MDMDLVREYIRLRRAQKQHDAEAQADKEAADALQERLLEEFAEDGVQNMSIDGTTVYLQRTLRAQIDSAYDKPEVVERLRQAGLDHFVSDSYNMNTLSAWYRELDTEGDDLPPSLEGVIRPFEKFELRTRRS